MPEMDGYETTTQWRQREQQAGIDQHQRAIIIALTADAFEENRQRCLACGMDDLLAKPITALSLKEKIIRAISNRQQEQQQQPQNLTT